MTFNRTFYQDKWNILPDTVRRTVTVHDYDSQDQFVRQQDVPNVWMQLKASSERRSTDGPGPAVSRIYNLWKTQVPTFDIKEGMYIEDNGEWYFISECDDSLDETIFIAHCHESISPEETAVTP